MYKYNHHPSNLSPYLDLKMWTYRFNVSFVFLFCRSLPSSVLVIISEINTFKKNPKFKQPETMLRKSRWQRSKIKGPYCIHWWRELHNIRGVICSGIVWKSLFGQMITGLPVTIKTQDSHFSSEWSFSNVSAICLCISWAEKIKPKERTHFKQCTIIHAKY